MLNISVKGLQNSYTYALKPSLTAKSQKELENEILPENLIKTSNEKSEAYLGEKAVKVLFEDAQSQRLVSMRLSEGNFARLKAHFNENDFYQRADGNIRLNGKAQNFLSGWFANAAYELNMLKADANKDGLVADKELENTFFYECPYFEANAKKASDITELRLYGGGKIAFNDTQARLTWTGTRAIEDTVNNFLELDENLNGKISFEEIFGGEGFVLSKAEQYVESKANNLKELEKLKIQEELDSNIKKPENKNVKKKALEQGLQALSADELSQLKAKDPLVFERLSKNTELENLAEDFKEELLRAIKENELSLIDIKA